MFKVFPGDEVVCQKIPGSKAKIKEVLKEIQRAYWHNKKIQRQNLSYKSR